MFDKSASYEEDKFVVLVVISCASMVPSPLVQLGQLLYEASQAVLEDF